MMDKVHKSDVSRLSMFKSMLQSICASKGRSSYIQNQGQFYCYLIKSSLNITICIKNCNIVKCLFKCVISKCSQLLRFTQHHGLINE